MKLTGKCKEDFEKWYLKTYHPNLNNNTNTFKLYLLVFYSLEPSKQYGVYVDYFDNVNFTILISHGFKNNKTVFMPSYENSSGHNFDYNTYYETRHEARTSGIEKANEIYNKQ
jgi:hypothetical protein